MGRRTGSWGAWPVPPGRHLGGRDSPEPVGESHHDVERSQEEDKVEEEVAVGHPLALVVDDPLAAFALVVRHKLLLHWRRQDRKTNRRPIGSSIELPSSSLK